MNPLGSFGGSEVEVGGGSGVDDGDIDESEVVWEVKLEVRVGARRGDVRRLEKTRDAELVG